MQDHVTAGLMRNNLPLGVDYGKKRRGTGEGLLGGFHVITSLPLSPLPPEKSRILACCTGNRDRQGRDANKPTPVCLLSKIMLAQDFIGMSKILEGNEERAGRG